MMTSVGVVLSMLAVGSGAACDCKLGWANVIEKTETIIVHKEPLRVPKDPLGTKHDAACIRLVFGVDASGAPKDLRIDRSSQNRTLDVAARETLKKYKFRPPSDRDVDSVFALVFEIPSD